MKSTDRPAFQGLTVYRHLRHRFSLLYPEGWGRAEVPRSAGGGVVFSPDGEDRQTSVLVQSRKLPSAVRAEDLDALRGGLLEGIQQLPEAHVQQETAEAVGKLLTAEAQHTYRDAKSGVVRKRWVRLLCQGNVQVSVVCQGSTKERFDYWSPMFNTVMRTVQFADWWAEVIGVSWKKDLKGPAEALADPSVRTG